jgi:hypothetical protein
MEKDIKLNYIDYTDNNWNNSESSPSFITMNLSKRSGDKENTDLQKENGKKDNNQINLDTLLISEIFSNENSINLYNEQNNLEVEKNNLDLSLFSEILMEENTINLSVNNIDKELFCEEQLLVENIINL